MWRSSPRAGRIAAVTRWATLVVLSAAACRPAPPPPPAPESCLDQQLKAKGLNPFGDPPDTFYAGGTPLFDEKTGRSVPREQYVLAKHPDIARACGADAGP
jgi:hypothetical protein